MIILQNLENYLRNHNGNSIIEEEARNHFLSQKSLRLLLNRLKDFTELEYSSMPKRDKLIAVAQMTILLFPSMKEPNSTIDGIVRINADIRAICES